MKQLVASWARRMVVAAILSSGLFVFGGSPVSAGGGGNCQKINLSVSMTMGQPANQTLAGTLCQPTTWAVGPHQIDVMVHGAGFNSSYWDFPTQAPKYSYVSKTLRAGRATFAYDRIGTGVSSKPLAASITFDSDVYELHQVVGWLRNSGKYTQVNSIGNSLGSAIVIGEASSYKDIDRLIVTGGVRAVGTLFTKIPSSFYPAMLDPKFVGLLDPDYITTTPGSRYALFFNGTADPAVVAADENLKDKVSATEMSAGIAEVMLTPPALNISQSITVPVFSIVGDQDNLSCGLLLNCSDPAALQAEEAAYYPNAASITTYAVPNTAHALTLHPTADLSFNKINDWINNH